jgi:hypothetical protein
VYGHSGIPRINLPGGGSSFVPTLREYRYLQRALVHNHTVSTQCLRDGTGMCKVVHIGDTPIFASRPSSRMIPDPVLAIDVFHAGKPGPFLVVIVDCVLSYYLVAFLPLMDYAIG